MADGGCQFEAAEREETEMTHAAGTQLRAKIGRPHRRDQLARARPRVEPVEQRIHLRRDRRATQRRELAVLGDIGDR